MINIYYFIKMDYTFRKLAGHTLGVTSVAISFDGSQIASCSYDKTIRLWNAHTYKLIQELTGHTNVIYSVSFSFNGNTIVSSGFDKTIRLWNADTGQLIKVLSGHISNVKSVTFVSDDNAVLSGSHDMTVRLWNTNTGQHQVFAENVGLMHSIALDVNGKISIVGNNHELIWLLKKH